MLVVLFGAQAFPKSRLKAHTAFAKAAADFEEYCRSVLEAEVNSFFDSAEPWTQQLAKFRHIIARDHGHQTLIVYYVGHGIFPKAGSAEFYALALAETESSAEHRTSLQVPSLAEDIRAATCPQRIVIVDACFAAASVAHFQSESYVRRLRPSFANVAGTAVLAAASKDDFAKVESAGESTTFTRALLDVLRDGDESTDSKRLSLREIAALVAERIESIGGSRPELHVPGQGKGRVDELQLFPNAKPAADADKAEERKRERERQQHRRFRIRRLGSVVITAAVAAVVGLVAREVGFFMRPTAPPPKKKYEMASHEHYLALKNWSPPIEAAKELSPARAEVYCEIWSQRFAGGSLFLPSRCDVYGEPRATHDLEHTLFMITRTGASLAHIRPPIQGGIETIDTFRALLTGKHEFAEYLSPSLFPRGATIPTDELERLFKPHAEGHGASLSGGLASAYLRYDLSSVIGLPIERMVATVGLLREYDRAYVIFPLPAPHFEEPAPVPDGPRCAAKPDALNSIYVVAIDKERQVDTSPESVTASAGGYHYGLGHWRRIVASPSEAEQKHRPPRGFFEH